MNEKPIRRGDVIYVSPTNPVGSEYKKSRPTVVVSNDDCNATSSVIEVAYLTLRHKPNLPTHVYIKDGPCFNSTVLCEQITSVSVERLGDFMCHLPKECMQAIDKAIALSFGLDIKNPNELTSAEIRYAENDAYLTEIAQLKARVEDLEVQCKKKDFTIHSVSERFDRIRSLLSTISSLSDTAKEVIRVE